MEPTTLIDGRQITAAPCLNLEEALLGATYTDRAHLYESKLIWYVECQCCNNAGEHFWSPSGHGVDPDGGHYSCGPCVGTGRFKIQTA